MSFPWFTIDKNPPKITDWLQALGAIIAVIAAIIGFVKLFRRDKNREKEIKSLTAIADAQQQNLLKVQLLLEESQKQTQEFMIQSSEMQESNALYKRHLEILTDSAGHNKEHQEKLIELQKAQRKNDILPRFKYHGASTMGVTFHLDLQLVRNIAYLEEVRNEPGAAINFQAELTRRPIGTNETIHLTGSLTHTSNDIHNFYQTARFKFDLLFRNEDNDHYKQVVQRTAVNQIDVLPPEEVRKSLSN